MAEETNKEEIKVSVENQASDKVHAASSAKPKRSTKSRKEGEATDEHPAGNAGAAEISTQSSGIEEQKAPESKEDQQEHATKKHTAEDLELDRENVMLFGRYPIKDVIISDPSMTGYVKFNMQAYPNIFGRRRRKSYYDSHISIIERLINKLMRGGTGKKVGGKVIRTNGRLQGKKLKVLHIVENSFAIIHKKTGKNPVQVFIDALQNSAPIEDTTRVRYGGISYNVAVGISANRRVDVALKNIALASLIGAFKKKKNLSEALADELYTASQNLPESYAIKKRVESERIARRAR